MTAKDVGVAESEWQDFLKLEDASSKQGQLMFSDIRSKRNDRFAEHDDVIDGHSSQMLEMINIWQAAIEKQAARDNASMNQALALALNATAVLLVIALILGSVLAYLLSKQINSLLGAVAKKLEVNVENVRVSSNGLTKALQSAHADWRARPSDADALKRLRRGFHTLKGSAPLVGATALAECSRHLEQLVSRFAEKPATPDMVRVVEYAIQLLPACADAIRAARPLPAQLRAIEVQVQRYVG